MHPLSAPAAVKISRRRNLFRALGLATLVSLTSAAGFAQNPAPATDDANRRRRPNGDDTTNGRRGNFNPEDIQARMLTSLRERLEVTDDDEWKLIAERIAKVSELRRNSGAGLGAVMSLAGRGGPPGGGDNRGGAEASRGSSRGTRAGGSTEMAALQTAIRDKLPDAEIKSRLDRVRENRKDNEAKLAKAKEELRALLTVRQEAVAVVFGLLP